MKFPVWLLHAVRSPADLYEKGKPGLTQLLPEPKLSFQCSRQSVQRKARIGTRLEAAINRTLGKKEKQNRRILYK
ncbi:hypothetical protein HMPREF2141_02829 [Bacteroides uniformis]|nr:hypothetical protein HMPREF2141_02829 [Bacteroides uniformis]